LNQLNAPILSLLIFSPLLGVLLILLSNREAKRQIRNITLFTALGNLVICLIMVFSFKNNTSIMQFEENKVWIREFGINYHLGVDGISLLLIFLTSFLTVICILASWNYITKRVKEYHIFFLLLETGMLGCFMSLDLILFYIFWEAMLVPMYFIIGVWGGPRRIYAAIKFFLFTMVGSVLMLVAIIALYFIHKDLTGVATFDLEQISHVLAAPTLQLWLFAAFALAFAIKVPMFPFHTWLPDAHVEAPTAGSVILAGVLLKMGIYGFLRFAMPMFPYAVHKFMPLICTLAVIGIVYGALVAMVQPDIKKLVAYSSVSHLGFVMLGLFALNDQGMQGGILQSVNHGFSTGALFLIVGMLYERRHTRMIADYGGIARVTPVLFVFFLVVTLSSIGLPGLNGFVGEFLILVGSFTNQHLNHAIYYTIIAATGIIFAAIYMLWMFQRVMYGPVTKPENQNLKDLSIREWAVLLPIVIFIFVIGVYSKPFTKTMDASVRNLQMQIQRKYDASLNFPKGEKAIILIKNTPSSEETAAR
jgi:NADH-quinone oxidoreductase subunit M